MHARRVLAAQVLAAGGLTLLMLLTRPTDAVGVGEMFLAILVFTLSMCSGLLAHRTQNELDRLTALMREVRVGREPIETLSRFEQPLSALAGACEEMACDLREKRAQVASLEAQVQQRIANRTEALERTIGTLRQQASRDALTGLYNRRTLDTYLPQAIARCQSGALPMCLLMIDVDHFKALNDTLGHASGDGMLRSIAQLIRSTARETDLTFRNGGDEFVIVLEGADVATGRSIAERLNSLGDALGRTFRITPQPRLSIGMVMLSEVKDASAPLLLRRADEALYLVKARHHAEAHVLGDKPRRTG